MSTYSKEDRHAALKFASRLADLAKDAPDAYSKRCVYQAVNDLRKMFGFSDDDKLAIVRHWLSQGCSSYDDLSHETGFNRYEVMRIVGMLKCSGAASVTSLYREGAGRPTVFIQLLTRRVE